MIQAPAAVAKVMELITINLTVFFFIILSWVTK